MVTLKQLLHNRKAMGGLIVVIMILSYMMAVSTSTVLVIRSERQATDSSENMLRAQAAAMSGINFYRGMLYATDTTMLSGTDNYRARWHFLAKSDLNKSPSGAIPQQVATCNSSLLPANFEFTTICTSTWMYPKDTDLYTANDDDCSSSSIFIIKTYADQSTNDTLASYVYIKSLGAYRDIEPSAGTIIASYYCEYIARLEIAPQANKISIDRIQQIPIEYPFSITAPFHTRLYLPWQ